MLAFASSFTRLQVSWALFANGTPIEATAEAQRGGAAIKDWDSFHSQHAERFGSVRATLDG